MTNHSSDDNTDYPGLMLSNLLDVFNERDGARRLIAIGRLYAVDAVLYEPRSTATTHAEINEAAERILSFVPPDFVFSASSGGNGHHGAARLFWSLGPAGQPAASTGSDFALFKDGRIQSLYVFLDPRTRES